MLSTHRFTTFAWVVLGLACLSQPGAAKKTEKPDKDLTDAIEAEHAGDFEKALDLINKALAKKPGEMVYQIASYRIHFECGAMLVHRAVKLRNTGDLNGALLMLQKAYEVDPSSDQAKEEINRTKKMIERYEKGDTSQVVPTPAEQREEDKTLTPAELERKKEARKVASILGVPELKSLNPDPINLKMTNQKPRVLFDTVGKLAGINVIFDPDYDTTNTIKQTSIDLTNASLNEALDDVGIVTKSFWKVLTPNTIFVTQESRQKRQEYEEQVVKVFYLQNVTAQAELNEAVTVLRTVADIQKIFTSTPLNAIVIRASADKIPLAEKLIAAIDKPKSEVILDVMVMEVNRTYMRNLSAAIGVGGINTSINFTPRTALQGQSATTSSTTATTGTTTATTTTSTTGSTTSTNNTILLPYISHISTADYTVSNVPGGLIEALLSDASTKVLQAPQIRALDNFKASLKIGEKIPTATGSFQPGVGGVGVNPLVNTQFTYLDVGVNVDVTPRVNSATDVSSHVAVEVSQEDSTVSIGGIDQPVIGQKRVEMDLRMKDGEINIIGGLLDDETDKTISGVPGLASIPLVGNLFKSTNLNKTQQELLIVIVPHIIRSPDITDEDLKAVATGNETTYKLNYAVAKTAAPVEKTTPISAAPGLPPATAPLMTTPAAAPVAPPPPPAAPVAASFIATPAEAPLGSTVTANVQLNGVTDLSAVQMALKFDPKILRINNILGGELIRRNGPELVPSRNVLNDAGTATIGIARSPASGGISGTGTVLTFVFQTVGRGPTTVSVPQFTLTGAGGQPIPATPPTLTINVR